MLKTKEVEITLHPSNVKYYEELGYEIPREKVSGKYVVRKGTKIIVKVEDLLPGANVIVVYKCDYCGKEKSVMYCDYTRKSSEKDCCIDCLSLYRSELNNKQWEEKLNSNTKICSKCKREFPKTTVYFFKSIDRPDGLTCQCKECASNRKMFGVEKKIRIKIKKVKQKRNYNLTKDGFKICRQCERELPLNTDYFYKKHDTKDGFVNKCKECSGGQFTEKLTRIPQEGYKFCIKCDRELQIDIKYFPPDKMCKDGFRNVCRECGEDKHFMEDGYIPKLWWTDEENKLFIERYSHYTCEELINNFYPELTTKQVWDHAYNLRKIYNFDLYKTEEVQLRANNQRSEKTSGEKSPMYGKPKSEETKRKFRVSISRYYENNNGWWLGKKRSNEQRKMLSLRMKGNWAGSKNPRVDDPLIGKDNPNWKGGRTALYFELRSEIKEWQKQSMISCHYKCILSGKDFDNIHHLYPFRKIVDEVFDELNLDQRQKVMDYSEIEFDMIKNKLYELHIKHGLGVCLSKELHKLFHDTYGYTNNTPEQFYEFEKRYKSFEFDDILSEKYRFNNCLKEVG